MTETPRFGNEPGAIFCGYADDGDLKKDVWRSASGLCAVCYGDGSASGFRDCSYFLKQVQEVFDRADPIKLLKDEYDKRFAAIAEQLDGIRAALQPEPVPEGKYTRADAKSTWWWSDGNLVLTDCGDSTESPVDSSDYPTLSAFRAAIARGELVPVESVPVEPAKLVKFGSRIRIDGAEHVLANVGLYRAAAISLENGNRHTDPVDVASFVSVTSDEMKLITGGMPYEIIHAK